MNKLNKSEYNRVAPLLKDIKHNRALIFSIIDSNLNANIFVDNQHNPKAALLLWEFSFLLGLEENNEFNKNIYDYILNNTIQSTEDSELILFLDIKSWPNLVKLLNEQGCITIKRKMFSFSPDKFHKLTKVLSELPHDLTLSTIDINASKNIGFCVKKDNKIISSCISVAVGANEAEIDILTDENYRKRGLATIVATAFINHCLNNDMLPVWSCWPERKGSIALANKLGFDENEDVPVILWAQDM